MQQQRQYVGIDLHRRRSVIVRMAEDGQVLGVDQVVNDPVELSMPFGFLRSDRLGEQVAVDSGSFLGRGQLGHGRRPCALG
jgi:hypothetical protein